MLAAALEASRRAQSGGEAAQQSAAAAPTSTTPYGIDDSTAALLADTEHMDIDSLRRVVQREQTRGLPAAPVATLKRVPEVTEDFVRNFLVRNGMRRTLELFEVEWYAHAGACVAPNNGNGHGGGSVRAASAVSTAPLVPDCYLESAALLNRIEALEHDLRQHAELTARLTKQWIQAKKDADLHRTSHHRVVQEKNRLERLLRRAHVQAEDVSPALTDLRQRCETLFKAKTLMTLEKDKWEQRAGQLEKRVEELQQLAVASVDGDSEGNVAAGARGARGAKGSKATGAKIKAKARSAAAAASTAIGPADDTAATPFSWPADERPHIPLANKRAVTPQLDIDPTLWSCQESFLAHRQAVTALALHPFKPAVATGSDDGTWRISVLPQGEAVVTAEGHANWVSSIAFHPTGTLLATGAGDKSVKLWSLATNACAMTLLGHTDGVWSVDFQDTGALIASSGLDRTARVWDVELGRCRQTLRGHSDAVNAVRWQPGTNVLATGSADRTVALWDARIGCCAQTLHGHRSAVRSVCVPPPTAAAGGGSGRVAAAVLQLLSCDAEGVVKLWDLRMMRAKLSVGTSGNNDAGSTTVSPLGTAANHVEVDASSTFAAVASDDGRVRVVDLSRGTVTDLPAANGHGDAVLCVGFDPSTNHFLVTCGADGTVRYWSQQR